MPSVAQRHFSVQSPELSTFPATANRGSLLQLKPALAILDSIPQISMCIQVLSLGYEAQFRSACLRQPFLSPGHNV